jgi:hypothetical protein
MRAHTTRDPDREATGRRPAPPAAQPAPMIDLQRSAGNQAVTRHIQRMAVRSVKTPSIVSKATHDKHVVAEADQEAEAKAGYGSRTFVTSDGTLTAIVDADPFDFTEPAGRASARKDIQADVVITQFSKKGDPPASFAKGNDVTKTIDKVSTKCEIGAEKSGDDKIKITHFKKL